MDNPILYSSTYSHILQIALKAVQEGYLVAEYIRRSLKEDEMMSKWDASPVTIADLAVQTVIAKNLFDSNLKYTQILAEEDIATVPIPFLEKVADILNIICSRVNWSIDTIFSLFEATQIKDDVQLSTEDVHTESNSRTINTLNNYWILDPIDGTKGYINPSPTSQYAIALSYIQNGKILIGVLGCPNLPINQNSASVGCIAFAIKSEGAKAMYLPSDYNTLARPSDWKNAFVVDLHTSPLLEKEKIIIAESADVGHTNLSFSSEIQSELQVPCEAIQMSSQAKYVIVARGDCHATLRFPKITYKEYVWDHCAGALIVEEAGGCVCHADGKPLICEGIRQMDNSSGIIVVCDDKLKKKLLETIQILVPHRFLN